MVRAGDDVFPRRTVRQRAVGVRAAVGDGVDLAADVEQRDLLAIEVDDLRGTLRAIQRAAATGRVSAPLVETVPWRTVSVPTPPSVSSTSRQSHRDAGEDRRVA